MKTQKMKYTAGVRKAIGFMTKLVCCQGKSVALLKTGAKYANIPAPYWGQFDFFDAITWVLIAEELAGGRRQFRRTVQFFWRGQKVAIVGLSTIMGDNMTEEDGDLRWRIFRLEYQTVINLPDTKTEWFSAAIPDEGCIPMF